MEIEKIKKRFANHKAIFTDYGNIKILDFKNPDSFEYRIRFLFEEDYCRLHISGDLGELIASNYNNMTYEKFGDYVDDTGYFEGKICCHSRDIYYYDNDKAKEDIKKWIDENYIGSLECFINEQLRDDYNDIWSDEELLDEFLDDVLVEFEELGYLSTMGFAKFNEKMNVEWEDLYDIGKVRTDILEWYMIAFKLAQEDLNKGGDDNNA